LIVIKVPSKLLYTVHSTQYTVHSTQYTVHSTQYTVHSTQLAKRHSHFRFRSAGYLIYFFNLTQSRFEKNYNTS